MHGPTRLLRPLLRPLSWIYAAGVARHNARIDRRPPSWFHRLDRPVISIGNLSVGGSGKTPFTLTCAGILRDRGRRVGVLSRGYRRSSRGPVLVARGDGPEVDWRRGGDEPVLLARKMPGLYVAVAEARAEAGRLLLAEEPGPDLFLLDDGFQHRRLHRDLDLVLARDPAELLEEPLLPAGRLREPVASLARADALVATGGGDPTVPEELLAAVGRALPLFVCDPRPGRLMAPGGRTVGEAAALDGERVAAFCAVARPEGFFRMLERQGANLVVRQTFRDHHPFRASELQALVARARRAGATRLVTTEKDLVRLEGLPLPETPALVALELELVPRDRDGLADLLCRVLPAG